MLTSVEKIFNLWLFGQYQGYFQMCAPSTPRPPSPPKNPFILHRFESGNRSCLGGYKLDIVLIGSE